jgi:hypothetical protein
MESEQLKQEFSLVAEKDISLLAKELVALMRAAFARGAYFQMRVKGYSMNPFIKEGDMVTISGPRSFSDTFGRIAAFSSGEGDNLFIHRIVGKKEGFYLEKGDNSFGSARIVAVENILGYVVKVERQDNDVSFGLGKERLIIASLSRMNALIPFVCPWRLLPFKIRKAIKSFLWQRLR